MGQEDGYYWKRIGAVELLARTKDGIKSRKYLPTTRYEGLNFRFNVRFNEDLKLGTQGKGNIGILGLNAQTIRNWASAATPDELRKKQRFVRVYAGYEKDGPIENCELFTLPYIGALPSSPPEMWLNFNCPNNVALISRRVLHSPFMGQPAEIKSVFEELIKEVNKNSDGTWKMQLKWKIPEEVERVLPKVRVLDYSGMMIKDIIAEVNSWGIVWAHSSNKFSPRTGKTTINVWVAPIPKVDLESQLLEMEEPPIEISAENGMIGFPQFGEGSGAPCVQVKCLLRRDISIGDNISVKSEFMDAPYKMYKVNEVVYEGEFRGQPWYVTYQAQAVDVRKNLESAKKSADSSGQE